MPGVGTTHHVNIGGHYYLVRPGSYLKKAAPSFGARFTTGDPDFNNLSLWQHWAQRCFIGGFDQDLWADDAMFDQGIGLNTTEHEKVTITRDLSQGVGSNWGISSLLAASGRGYRSIIYNNLLYVLTLSDGTAESRLWRYDAGTDGWTRITSFDGVNVAAWSIAVFDGKLFIGGAPVGSNTGRLAYSSGSLTSWTVPTNPSGLPSTSMITSMRSFQQRLYVAYAYSIYRLKLDITWDGNTVFYKANASSESNGIASMEVHLGFLYMLSFNGHIHRTDGNSTFDIWNWDGQTEGTAIRSFDGRLFILTFEYTNTSDIGYGSLYQMSGSAVTLLKRWGNDTNKTRIGSMTVFDRRLFYGASNLLGFGSRNGFGVATYDPVEDAHSIIASNSDTVTWAQGSAGVNFLVDDQIFYQGKLFCFVRGHGAFYTPYKPYDLRNQFRRFDITPAAGSLAATNGGWLTTSTYDAGTPGVIKLWRKISVDCKIATNTGIVVDYSTDNGTTWTTALTISTVTNRNKFDVHLNNIQATSFKLRFTLRTTDATVTPILYGFVVSYLPTPEPNWMWSMTLVLAEKLVLLDATEETLNTESEITFLSDMFRDKVLVNFVDAEGISWAAGGNPGVLVHDITFALRDLNQPLEGEVTITLIEAVETYA
jgi:hypothetical protein